MQVVHIAFTYLRLTLKEVKKTAERSIVRHPAKLSNMLDETH